MADEGQEGHDAQRRQEDGGQLGGRDEQAEQEEDHHLAHAGHHIKEVDEVALLRNARIAHQDAAQVDAQVAVAADEVGQGVGDDGDGKDQDGPAVIVRKGQAREQQHGQLAHDHAAQHAEHDLRQQHPGHRHRRARHHRHQDDSQHVGHRVVGARFHLEQRGRAVLERQMPGAQDVKDRGRVGRGDDRADEQALVQRQPQGQMGEQAGQAGRQHKAQRGQHDRLCKHRPGGL